MVQRKRGRASKKAQKSSRSLQQPNVWVILSVAVLVIGLTVITSFGPSSVTGNTIQNIGRMNKGDPLHLSVQGVPTLETVFTNAGETIQSGKITVTFNESIPFDRLYVTKFTVSSENKWGPLQFTFKVKEQDLLDKGISRYDLRLYSGLKEYPLQLLKVNHGYLYYIVTVPSLGKFVLGRVAATEKETVVSVAKAPSATEDRPPWPEKTGSQSAEAATEDRPPWPEKKGSLVGKAAELPAGNGGEGLWARIAQFFRNLFS